MKRQLPLLPPPHVQRPEPALELAMLFVLGIGAASVLLILWSAMTGMSLSPLSWYLARGSGVGLYLMTWFLVVGGLTARTKLLVQTGRRSLMMSLHGFGFHLWYGLLALHLLTIVIDPTVSFGLGEVLVPFTSGWREPWTGLGVLAAQAGVVVGASAGIRRLVGYRIWKAMHWLSLPMFVLSLLHGLLAGTDGSSLPLFMTYVVTGGWVVFLLAYRLLRWHARDEKREERRQQAILATNLSGRWSGSRRSRP
jgi:methionine sulfoxide reductase heme-binding subunit